jgi:hypothetical protein
MVTFLTVFKEHVAGPGKIGRANGTQHFSKNFVKRGQFGSFHIGIFCAAASIGWVTKTNDDRALHVLRVKIEVVQNIG